MAIIGQSEFSHPYFAVNTFIAPMTKIIVDPGACGFTCRIEVQGTAKYEVTCHLQSKCKQIKKWAEKVGSVNFLEISRGPFGQNSIARAAARCKLHPSCPIPSGLIKAVEAELGMAVRKNVSFTFEEREPLTDLKKDSHS